MTKFWRLLMASTVLSGLAGLGSAHAGTIEGLRASPDATEAPIVLAQAVAPDDKNKKQNNNANQNRGNNNANQNPNRGNNNANQSPNRGNNNANQNPNRGNNNANQNPNRGNNNANQNRDRGNNKGNANNNRNNNANSSTTRTTTTPASPRPPVTNTQNKNNDNKGINNNRNNTGNANNNNNRNNNVGNANNRNNNGGANSNNRNNQNNNATQPTTTTANPQIMKLDAARARLEGNNTPIVSGGAGKGVAVQNSTGKTVTNVNDIKTDRTIVKEGNKTIIKEPGGNTIIKEGNKTIIRHDEANRFRVGAVNVSVQKAGADNRTIIVRPGGQKVVTLTDRNGFLLRRSIILPNGREIILINNRPRAGNFFIVLPPPMIRIPRDRYIVAYRDAPPRLLYDTLMGPPVDRIDRAYSLDEIRYSPTLRDRMPRIDIDSVTFDSGSWELAPEQIDKLGPIADAMKRGIEQNPQVVFLVEGYTDAVGDENDNLSLSDRRAEAVAVALTEQFGVPAENLSTQGYGEQDLKVPTDGPEEANRRVTIRNIEPLLNGKVAQGGDQRGGQTRQ